MVIFHSYVSLPEGIFDPRMKAAKASVALPKASVAAPRRGHCLTTSRHQNVKNDETNSYYIYIYIHLIIVIKK